LQYYSRVVVFNIYPGSVRLGCSAAFSVPQLDTEALIYVCELGDTLYAQVSSNTQSPASIARYNALITAMNAEVSAVHGVAPSIVCLLAPRTIHKTTSGKIARAWVRRAYLEGKLSELYHWSALNDDAASGINDFFQDDNNASLTGGVKNSLLDDHEAVGSDNENAIDPTGLPVEQILVDVQKAVSILVNKPYQSLPTDVPLMRLGMDSMRGIELQSLIEKRFSVQLPEALMFEPDATIFTLAHALSAGKHTRYHSNDTRLCKYFVRVGGRLKHRPFMVKGWEVVQAARDQITGKNKGKTPPTGALPPNVRRIRLNVHRFIFTTSYHHCMLVLQR
jgi:acyl carrier protein